MDRYVDRFLVALIFALIGGATLLVHSGCTRSPSATPADFAPLAAAALTEVSLGGGSAPAPAPTPAPGICTNCNGKGRLGDGTVSVPCPVCGGDGRTDQQLPVMESRPVVSVLAEADVAKADCPCGDTCDCKSGHRIGDRVQHPGGYYELEWVWHPATARPATSAAGASPVRPTVPSPVAAPQGWVCEGGTCRYVGPQRSGRLGGRLFGR